MSRIVRSAISKHAWPGTRKIIGEAEVIAIYLSTQHIAALAAKHKITKKRIKAIKLDPAVGREIEEKLAQRSL